MNVETGEMRELPKTDANPVLKQGDPVLKQGEVIIAVGDIHEFVGCPCKVVHVNPGKGRISIQPLGKLKMRDADPRMIPKKNEK